MALDVYVAEDIKRGIQATVVLAVSCYYAQGGRNVEHVAGILAHAQSMALMYGLSWQRIVTRTRYEMGADVRGLLDAALKSAVLEMGQ